MKNPLLLGLLIFSFFLFFYQLASIPQALLEHEIQSGLAVTPLGAYIDTTSLPPLSLLVIAIFVKLFGLSAFAIRLSSVIFGILALIIFYVLAEKLYQLIKTRIHIPESYKLSTFPLLATVIFALSPWYIQIARINTGLILGLCLFFFGIYLLLTLYHKPKYFFLWIFPCIGSIYADYSFFLPTIAAFILSLFLLIKKSKQFLPQFLFVGISFFLLLPLAQQLIFFTTAIDDTKLYWIFFNERQTQERVTYSLTTPVAKMLHNKYIENAKITLQTLTSYTEPHELFATWTHNPKFISPYTGLFHPFDLIFLLAGLLFLLKHQRMLFALSLFWICLSLFPITLTTYSPDPQKTILLLPLLAFVISLGVLVVSASFSVKHRMFFYIVLGLFVIFFTARFTQMYFVNYPQTVTDYESQYTQAFAFTENLSKPIIITDVTYGKNMYLYWLFTKPNTLPLVSQQISDTQHLIKAFGNYRFVSQLPSPYSPEIVYIQPTSTLPIQAKVLFQSSTKDTQFQISVFTIEHS